jgi:hypothetical protein
MCDGRAACLNSQKCIDYQESSVPMKNLFEPASTQEVKDRVSRLEPDSERLWGTMHVAQAVAHCAAGMELATGDRIPLKVAWPLRIIGRFVKPMALGNDTPMRRNSPSTKDLLIHEERDLRKEQERLCSLIDRFAAAGPAGCTKHPHSFFGRLTSAEWSELMYKHLDHHLRQFGV